MAEDVRGSSFKDSPAGTRRRAPVTIDGKAVEVAPESAKSAEPVDPVVENAKPETPAETPPIEPTSEPIAAAESAASPPPEAEAETASSTEPKPSERRESDWLRVATPEAVAAAAPAARSPWPIVGAGLAGAALSLGVVGAMWALGAFASQDDGAVTPRLAAIEGQLRDLASRPAPAPAVPDQAGLADLRTRLGTAEQAVKRLADLDARIAKAETAASAPRAAAPDQALAGRVATLETSVRPLADLSQRVDAATVAAREAQARADAAAAAAQANGAQPAAPAVEKGEIDAINARLAALEQSAKTLEQKIASVPTAAPDRAGRLAFTAVALRAAVERGEPFSQEIAVVKPLVSDTSALAPLEPFAATGVPRGTTLARELSNLTTRMLNATNVPAQRESGIMDRLQASAERLVRIRPINEAPGDDPTTVVTRADVKATRGDIAGAVAELKRLPDPVRAPAEDWIKRAEAQIAALAAAQRLADAAVAALAKTNP
jgi:hypothetical protein